MLICLNSSSSHDVEKYLPSSFTLLVPGLSCLALSVIIMWAVSSLSVTTVLRGILLCTCSLDPWSLGALSGLGNGEVAQLLLGAYIVCCFGTTVSITS